MARFAPNIDDLAWVANRMRLEGLRSSLAPALQQVEKTMIDWPRMHAELQRAEAALTR